MEIATSTIYTVIMVPIRGQPRHHPKYLVRTGGGIVCPFLSLNTLDDGLHAHFCSLQDAPSTPSSHSASTPKARRALPPTPASASFPPTLNVSMPEPARIDYENHYHHPSRVSYANESHATADSNDLLRKAVTAPSSGRRLPPAPAPGGNGGSKTSPTSPWLPGLPTDPRPTSRTSSLGYAQSSTSSNPPSGSGANVSRTPSDRPPGAKFSVSPSAYSSTHGEDSRYTNDYFGGGQETRHPTDNGYQARPYHLPTSANSLTTHHDLRHKPSRENMSGTQDLYEAYSPQTARACRVRFVERGAIYI